MTRSTRRSFGLKSFGTLAALIAGRPDRALADFRLDKKLPAGGANKKPPGRDAAGRGDQGPVLPQKFSLDIQSFAGAAGYTLVYRLSPDEITVTVNSDWADKDGRPARPKELFRSPLTDAQRLSLRVYLARFPLERLRDSYVDPRVFDGTEITFNLAIDGRQPRKIFLGNRRQVDLASLCERVSKLVPEKYKIHTP